MTRWRALLVATSLAACSDTSTTATPSPIAESTQSVPDDLRESVHELLVVAHEDDDLLFAAPDVASALTDGSTLSVAYLTGGDAGAGAIYYLERERGVEAAYAQRAGQGAPVWHETVRALDGHDVVARTLEGTGITLFFFRLPDGNGDGNGFATSRGTPNGSLAKLWDGRLDNLHVLDSTETYTRASLVRALTELADLVRPTRIGTLDPTVANGNDHSDHRASALFAQLAAPPELHRRLYRGYNIDTEPSNIGEAEATAKWQAFLAYAHHDTSVCPVVGCNMKVLTSYSAYSSREYLSSTAFALTGAFGSVSDLCVSATGDLPRAVACDDANVATLTLTADGILASGGRCLLESDGSALAWGACSPVTSGHRWTLLSSGNLISVEGSCLRAPDGPGAALTLSPCDRSRAALWSFRWRPDELLPGEASKPADQARLFGDVDGDGVVDVCARTSDGLECRGERGDAITVRNGTAFSDVRGWARTTGESLRMLDLDRDGNVDVCGLRDGGIACAFGEGKSGLGLPVRVSAAGDFDGAVTSLGFADVDGDGHVDACAAFGRALHCAHGNGRGFAPSRVWLGAARPLTTAAWIFADVSGDGRADACALSDGAITCAVAATDERRFVRSRPWALAPPGSGLVLSSARMADVDGDGDVDVCVRGPSTEISCAMSTGAGFGTFLPVLDRSRGTNSKERFELVSGRGTPRPSLCRWGVGDVRCSAAP